MTSSSLHTDIVIVGAGPAGSVAAQQLAAGGARVLLLEQGTFPRDKSCGDGLTYQGLAVLDRLGLSQWAAQFPPFEAIRFSSPGGQIIDTHYGGAGRPTAGRTIPRRLLDARLAQAAVEAGAQLREGVHVQSVSLNSGQPVTVRAAGLEVQARLLVLAEGSHATLARRLGLVQEGPELLAMRQYLAGDQGPADRMEIHFQGSIIPGYNWIFPLGGGRVNVGTGTYASRSRAHDFSLSGELQRFMRDEKISGGRLAHTEPASPVMGSPLRTRLDGTRTHAAGVLVAGDAAGLVNPFTGVGIGQAMRSGELAAQAGLQALRQGDFSGQALGSYTRALRAEYQADQQTARFLRGLLSNVTLLEWTFRRMQTRPELARLFAEIFLARRSPRAALAPGVLLKLLF